MNHLYLLNSIAMSERVVHGCFGGRTVGLRFLIGFDSIDARDKGDLQPPGVSSICR